jgi:uncharacterized membrane protein YfcA
MTASLIGMLIGMVLGLTGAGGSVLAVPMLMQGLQMSQGMAAGLSLGAVALAAAFGVLLRRGRGQIVWSAAFLLGVAGAAMAPLGQALAARLSALSVMTAFSFLVAVIALRMWRQAGESPAATQVLRADAGAPANASAAVCTLSTTGYFEWRWPCITRLLGVGALTGVLSGVFGVGGGFVIVPALVLLIGLSMVQAVATSLAIIMAVSASGFAGFAWQQAAVASGQHTPLWLAWWPVLAGSVFGMLLGTRLAPRLAGPALQRFFVVMMVALVGWSWSGLLSR